MNISELHLIETGSNLNTVYKSIEAKKHDLFVAYEKAGIINDLKVLQQVSNYDGDR